MQQYMLENSQTNQKMIKSCGRIGMHFDQTITHLNQPISIPIPDQTQEFNRCDQVNLFDIPQDFTPHDDTNFKFVPSLYHLNQITEVE